MTNKASDPNNNVAKPNAGRSKSSGKKKSEALPKSESAESKESQEKSDVVKEAEQNKLEGDEGIESDEDAEDGKQTRTEDRASVKNLSPVNIPASELAVAARGCKKDAEENEHFDPVFYKNLVAMRQHDPSKRPQTATQAEQMFEHDEVEVQVIAKKVNHGKDVRCKVTVQQKVYLGSGAFSDVYKGFVKVKQRGGTEKCTAVAIKKIWPDPSREDRQIAVHRRLDHPNLVRLLYYYVCIHPETKDTMWSLLMDLIPSTVAQEQAKYIDKGKIMPQIYIKLFMYQTFCGLLYLERNSFLHRDIKPENLLVDMSTAQLKIGDFGSAKRYRPREPNSSYQVTRYYRAPELCLKYGRYDCTVDVWSAGCILAEMLTNRIMFYGNDNNDQLRKIFRICGTPTIDQLRECVPGHQIDPKVLEDKHPPADWHKILRRYNRSVNKICSSFLGGILRYECNRRLRGPAALQHPFFDSIKKPHNKLPNGAQLPPLEEIH